MCKITSLHINLCDETYIEMETTFHPERKDNTLLLSYLTQMKR